MQIQSVRDKMYEYETEFVKWIKFLKNLIKFYHEFSAANPWILIIPKVIIKSVKHSAFNVS